MNKDINQKIKDIKYNIFSRLDEIENRIKNADKLTENEECFFISINIDTLELNIESSWDWKFPELEENEACFYSQSFGAEFDSVNFNFKGVEALVNYYN